MMCEFKASEIKIYREVSRNIYCTIAPKAAKSLNFAYTISFALNLSKQPIPAGSLNWILFTHSISLCAKLSNDVLRMNFIS